MLDSHPDHTHVLRGGAARLAAIAVAAATLISGCGLISASPGTATGTSVPSPSSPATATTPSSTVPSSAPTPSPAPSAVPASAAPSSTAPALQPCTGGSLVAELEDWQGAAGTRFGTVRVGDSGTADCSLSGTPGLQLVDGQGAVFLDSANLGEPATAAPAVPVLTLRAGSSDVAYLLVGLANYCGADPVAPVRLAIVLPDDLGRTVATAATGVTVEMAPCNGPSAPTTLHVQSSWSATAP